MALKLRQRMVGYLREHPEQKFTAREIAEWIFEKFPDECQAKKANSQYVSSNAELLQQFAAEINSYHPRLQEKHSELKTTEGRPRKYY